jgi:hypothetical protein
VFLFPQAEDSDDAVAEEPSEDFVLQDSSEEEPDIGVVLASVRFTPVSRPFHARSQIRFCAPCVALAGAAGGHGYPAEACCERGEESERHRRL